ncbi:MAG: Fic family protein [Bacteroidetes Order II. Incertae sedis bacterium]|nr:Fic family protein [Bacteroidetes Order II. bacterium]
MEDETIYRSGPDHNLLGITDLTAINAEEAKGIAKAEVYLFTAHDLDEQINISLLLKLHKMAFGHLYEWAGQWRKVQVVFGNITPPASKNVLHLLYQFLDNLNFKIGIIRTEADLVETLAYAHYQFIYIHPFMNGNGRMSRLITNLVALKKGYAPVLLGHRRGTNRPLYIAAMRAADEGDTEPLKHLIREDLYLLECGFYQRGDHRDDLRTGDVLRFQGHVGVN